MDTGWELTPGQWTWAMDMAMKGFVLLLLLRGLQFVRRRRAYAREANKPVRRA